jgi:hypothetical protein
MFLMNAGQKGCALKLDGRAPRGATVQGLTYKPQLKW